MRKRILGLAIVSMCVFTACGNQKESKKIENVTADIQKTEQEDSNKDKGNTLDAQNESVTDDTQNAGDISDTEPVVALTIKEADYGTYFEGLDGCAVIYDEKKDEYAVYHESMMNIQISPFSTFKIVSTLAGLKNGVLKDANSTMNYNGTQYPMKQWNHELTLKEAFQNSCVWYYRQVIDAIGQDAMQKELDDLGYGNCDISEWAGISEKPNDELSGFWLDSSLKISPMEQVEILKKIFEGKSQFTEEQINILKDIMLLDEADGYSIYGKTGTKSNQQGWYVGFAQKEDQKFYYAVYVNGEKAEKNATGAVARKIVTEIFSKN